MSAPLHINALYQGRPMWQWRNYSLICAFAVPDVRLYKVSNTLMREGDTSVGVDSIACPIQKTTIAYLYTMATNVYVLECSHVLLPFYVKLSND